MLYWFWCLIWLSGLKNTIYGEADPIRYAAEISAEFMYMMCYACQDICYPSLFNYDYIIHEDHMNSILLGPAPE